MYNLKRWSVLINCHPHLYFETEKGEGITYFFNLVSFWKGEKYSSHSYTESHFK